MVEIAQPQLIDCNPLLPDEIAMLEREGRNDERQLADLNALIDKRIAAE